LAAGVFYATQVQAKSPLVTFCKVVDADTAEIGYNTGKKIRVPIEDIDKYCCYEDHKLVLCSKKHSPKEENGKKKK